MNHDWNEAEVFCAVAGLGSFTAAATRLQMPKSSVSRAVSQFEARCGTRLLERSTRRLQLTEAGRELQEQLAPLFRRLHDVIEAALTKREQPHGVLRLSAPFEFGVLHLNQVICELLARHAGIEAEIEMSTRPGHPLEGNFDLVFTLHDEALMDSSLVARRVFTLETVLCAAPALVRQLGQPSHPDELATWPCLCDDVEALWRFTAAHSPLVHEVRVRGRLRTGNASLRLGAAEAGLGAAVITRSLCHEALEQGRLAELLPAFRAAPRMIYAYLPSGRLMPARVRLFLDALAALGQGDDRLAGRISPLRQA